MKLEITLPLALLGVAAIASPAGAQYRGHPPEPDYYYEAPPTYRYDGWQLRGETARAAHLLHERAAHFAEMLGNLAPYAHVSDDTYALGDAAMRLHQVVESAAPREHALSELVRVQQAWRHVREEFQHAHDLHHVGHLNDDWAALTEAFVHTAHALRDETHRSSYDPHAYRAPGRYQYREAPRYSPYRPRARVRVRAPRATYRYRYD